MKHLWNIFWPPFDDIPVKLSKLVKQRKLCKDYTKSRKIFDGVRLAANWYKRNRLICKKNRIKDKKKPDGLGSSQLCICFNPHPSPLRTWLSSSSTVSSFNKILHYHTMWASSLQKEKSQTILLLKLTTVYESCKNARQHWSTYYGIALF